MSISDELDLSDRSITFSVVEADGVGGSLSFVTSGFADEDNIYDLDEMYDYISENHVGSDDSAWLDVDAYVYNIGIGESSPASEEELEYIKNNLDDVINESTLLESSHISKDFEDLCNDGIVEPDEEELEL